MTVAGDKLGKAAVSGTDYKLCASLDEMASSAPAFCGLKDIVTS